MSDAAIARAEAPSTGPRRVRALTLAARQTRLAWLLLAPSIAVVLLVPRAICS